MPRPRQKQCHAKSTLIVFKETSQYGKRKHVHTRKYDIARARTTSLIHSYWWFKDTKNIKPADKKKLINAIITELSCRDGISVAAGRKYLKKVGAL